MSPGPPIPSPWLWFLPWAVIGAGACLSLLTILSIGFILAPATLIVAAVVAWASKGNGAMGVVSGLGAPLLYIAYENRRGPGISCTGNPMVGHYCSQEWSPWPWAIAALLLIVAGLAILISQHFYDPQPPPPPPFANRHLTNRTPPVPSHPSHGPHGTPSPPAWVPDPTGRYQYRWWNGYSFTNQVASGGISYTDPI